MNDSQPPRNDQLADYEPWLRMLARLEIDNRFQGKFSASDVVQQTMVEAWRCWDDFRGQDEQQRQAWMRQILAFQLAKLARHYAGAQKRNVKREVSIDASLAQSSLRIADLLAAEQSTPSERMMADEQSMRLAQVLAQLPDDYQRVIILRNVEELTHEEIADRMQRSVGAVRMLWLRALAALRQRIGESVDN